MKIYIIILFELLFVKCTICQTDTITDSGFHGEFKKTDQNEFSMDSTGRKQGEWYEQIESFPMIYPDTVFILEEVLEHGFYVDDHKEGIWEVLSLDNRDFHELKAQIFYIQDSIIYTIYYQSYKVRSIVHSEMIFRYNNFNSSGRIKIHNQINYNQKGKIESHEFYAPDGIYEIYNYKKYPYYDKNKNYK